MLTTLLQCTLTRFISFSFACLPAYQPYQLVPPRSGERSMALGSGPWIDLSAVLGGTSGGSGRGSEAHGSLQDHLRFTPQRPAVHGSPAAASLRNHRPVIRRASRTSLPLGTGFDRIPRT